MKAGGIIMKKNQLPKQVLNTLLAYQIKSDDILDVCPFDLSFDSEYISGYLFLTSTKIGVAKSRHEQMTVRYFRGTKTADMQYAICGAGNYGKNVNKAASKTGSVVAGTAGAAVGNIAGRLIK